MKMPVKKTTKAFTTTPHKHGGKWKKQCSCDIVKFWQKYIILFAVAFTIGTLPTKEKCIFGKQKSLKFMSEKVLGNNIFVSYFVFVLEFNIVYIFTNISGLLGAYDSL